ncbi:hypothetical protein ONZ45_g17785 [Pleurotus djamor]|nr:hypothetical protein ONZ45_g17785 [Pleurotus djamor]
MALPHGPSDGPLKELATLGDQAFVDFWTTQCIATKAADPDVCQGELASTGPIVAHDLRQISPNGRTATLLCDVLFGLCDPPPVIPFKFPLPTGPRRPPTHRRTGRKPFQVAHISDVHIDREYTVGADAQCNKNICCRVFPDSATTIVEPAGSNGNSHCDSPVSLANSMLHAINTLDEDIRFVIFTGDVVEGATWLVDRPEVTDDLSEFNSQLASKLRMPVFPAIGNHDSAPVNSFPRNTTVTPTDSQWVFDAQGAGWERWIHAVGAQQVTHMSGSYSVLVPGSHLRILSINTQYWYRHNFWLYDSDAAQPDPNGILAFIAEQLDIAERHNELVWIIGHIPLGKEDTMNDQSNYYDQILQRYRSAISGHFFGHSHKDQFEIAYSDYSNPSARNAVSMCLIAPALTPTSGNPAFKLYDVDPDTYEIMDARVFFTNLSDPDFQVQPRWELYYSARQSYGPLVGLKAKEPLSPAFWHRLTEVFASDDDVFQLFNTRISRGGAVTGCDSNCKNVTICDMRAFRAENNCDNPSPGLNFRKRSVGVHAEASPHDDLECGSSKLRQILVHSIRKSSSTPQ